MKRGPYDKRSGKLWTDVYGAQRKCRPHEAPRFSDLEPEQQFVVKTICEQLSHVEGARIYLVSRPERYHVDIDFRIYCGEKLVSYSCIRYISKAGLAKHKEHAALYPDSLAHSYPKEQLSLRSHGREIETYPEANQIAIKNCIEDVKMLIELECGLYEDKRKKWIRQYGE